MKAINLFPFLFTFLILACSNDDEKGDGKKPPPSYTSSSQVYMKVDTLHLEGLGQSYKTMKIGSLIWFAQNLNEIPTSGKWWCNGDIATRCDKYGAYYDWEAAKNVCPNGWHLPSKNEWEDLSDFLLSYPNNILTDAWWNPTYAGYRYEDGRWFPLDQKGYWWSSTGAGSGRAYSYHATIGQKRLDSDSGNGEKIGEGQSVRCVKNN